MKPFIPRNWLRRFTRFFSKTLRSTANRPHTGHFPSLEIEQLEDRTVPTAALPLGAGILMQPTYQLFRSSTRPATGSSLVDPAGLNPMQVRAAYGFNKITFQGNTAGDGSGETIAIVDAYDDPTAASDLIAFDQQFGLANPTFVKVGINAQGAASTSIFPTADADWSIEIALDVEWAHAIAPSAKILLVEANSNSYADLLNAVDYARNSPGVAAVSMSWGGSEMSSETSFDSHFTTPAGHSGVTFFASTGDSGAPALFPAVSSHVVAVGGTSLTVDASGNWIGESGWSGGGGGISTYITQPSYQDNLTIYGASANGMRATPDVSYDADPNTGVAVLSTYGYGGWLQVGGTSAAAPQWAALMSIVDQGRALLGESALDGYTQTLPDLYKLPSTDFHDITTGNNGFSAGLGYDLVTGLGSPIANFIVPDLIGVPQVFTSIAIMPANAAVSDGTQLQLSAIALDQFGKPMDIPLTFTWSLVNGQGTVDGNGLYTAPSAGSGTDTVSASTLVNGSVMTVTATVAYAPGLAITSISAGPGLVTGTTTTVNVTAINPIGGPVYYFWWVQSTPDGSVGAMFDDPSSSTTTATFFEPGAFTLEVFAYNLTGDQASATVDVNVVTTLSYVFLSPMAPDVPLGGQQQFSAEAYDQFFDPMPADFSWSLANGPGTINATGLYTAPASGIGSADVQATATVNGVTLRGDAYPILLQPPTVTAISASANPVTSAKLSVSAFDPYGGGLSYQWTTVAAPAGAKMPTFSAAQSATTNATFFQTGMYTFQVAITNTEGATTLATVNATVNPIPTTVTISPASVNVPDQIAQQFTASAFDQFHQPMSAAFAWSMVSGPGSINSGTGLYTPPNTGSGTAVIKANATANGVTLTHTATVTLLAPPKITSISASPNPVTGTTTKLSVAATNPNGGSLIYHWIVAASPAGASLPTIANAGAATTTATFFQTGSYSFQVTITNQKGSTTIATVNVTVQSVPTYLPITPATTTVARSSQQQFTVQVFDQFHTAMTPQSVTWSGSGSGSISSSGLFKAASVKGSAIITVKAIVNGITLTKTDNLSIV